MNTWSHLPNAQLIDWVIESVKNNPELWYRARDAAWVAALDAIQDEERVAAWVAICEAELNAAWYRAQDAAKGGAWGAAQDSVLSLFVYDDCYMYLAMTYEQLQVYAILSERPQAILLLPLKWVQEHEQYNTLTDCAS